MHDSQVLSKSATHSEKKGGQFIMLWPECETGGIRTCRKR